jgi:hypothetical protein
VLAAAQRAGEVRQDMPLPLLRDMVYGAMEHVLWDYMVNRNKPDIETTAGQLTDMVWTAFVPVKQSLAKLAQFRSGVAEGLRRLEGGG